MVHTWAAAGRLGVFAACLCVCNTLEPNTVEPAGGNDLTFAEISAEFGSLIRHSRQLHRFADVVDMLSLDEGTGPDIQGVGGSEQASLEDRHRAAVEAGLESSDGPVPDGEEGPKGLDDEADEADEVAALDPEGDEDSDYDEVDETKPQPETKMPWRLPAALKGPLDDQVAQKIYGLPAFNEVPVQYVWREKYAEGMNDTTKLGLKKAVPGDIEEDLTLRAKQRYPPPEEGKPPALRVPVPPQRLQPGTRSVRYDLNEKLETAADALSSFLEVNEEENPPDPMNAWKQGLVADYWFAHDRPLRPVGGHEDAPDLEDIGASCTKEAVVTTQNVFGESTDVLKFQKGTGFKFPNAKDFLGDGSSSHYSIIMRVKLYETDKYVRVLNLNSASDHGYYINKVLVCVPGTGGFHVVPANEWMDLGFQFAEGAAKMFFNGMPDKIWRPSSSNMGVQITDNDLLFFNDDGPHCTAGEENTAGEVARIMIYDRMLSEEVLSNQEKNPLNQAPFVETTVEHNPKEYYTGDNACDCPGGDDPLEMGHLKCVCESYCDCSGPPSIPPPPQIKWNVASDCGWTWKFRPHWAWAWWTHNRWMALAGGHRYPMTDLIKFNGLHSSFGRSGKIKVWRAELFTFHVRKGPEHRFSGYVASRNWNPWHTSWNNKPHTKGGALFTTDIRRIGHNRWVVSSGRGLDKQCEDWINGAPNYGMILKVTSEPGRHWYHFGILAGLHHPLKPRLRLWISKWN